MSASHSPNFASLAAHDPALVRYGALAERYCADDPNTSLIDQQLTDAGWLADSREIVVDREALDQDAFATQGGFRVIDRVFDGQVVEVLGALREAVWEEAG